VNRFFRSALFRFIIAALVWLALQTLGGHADEEREAHPLGRADEIAAANRASPAANPGSRLQPEQARAEGDPLQREEFVRPLPQRPAGAGLEQLLYKHGVPSYSKGSRLVAMVVGPHLAAAGSFSCSGSGSS